MKKILIVGSAGFIGSNLTRHLTIYHKDKYVVSGIDRLDCVGDIHNAYMNKNLFYIVNSEDEEMFNKIFTLENPDIVVYFGSNTDEQSSSCKQTINGHVKSLNNILSRMVLDQDSNKTFIYTTLTYELKTKTHETIDLLSEVLIEHYTETHSNLNSIILNTPPIFGARDKSSTIYKMYLALSKACSQELILENYGKFEQEYLYIEDYCNALVTVLNLDLEESKSFDIATNSPIFDIELATMINDTIGECKEKGKISFINNELNNNVVNTKRFYTSQIELLGWKPKRTFKENITYTIRWYNNNSWFFNSDKERKDAY